MSFPWIDRREKQNYFEGYNASFRKPLWKEKKPLDETKTYTMLIIRNGVTSELTYDRWSWGIMMLTAEDEWNAWLDGVSVIQIELHDKKLSQSLKSDADNGEESNSKI